MRKISFKITAGLKMLLVAGLIGGASIFGGKSATSMAIVAPLGLVASMKKKGIELEEAEKEIVNGIEAGINKAFEDLQNGIATKEQIEALTKQIGELSLSAKSITVPGTGKDGEADKTLEEFLRDRSKEITDLQKAGAPAVRGNAKQLQFDAINKLVTEAKARKEQVGDGSFSVSTDKNFDNDEVNKAAGTMTSGNAAANASGVTVPANYMYGVEDQAAEDARPIPYITPYLDNGNTNLPAIPYADKLPTEGTMAITAEGTLKPLVSFSVERRFSTAFKIAGRSKLTEEALDDIPGLQATTNNELRYAFDRADEAATFTHVASFAPGFVAGDLAASTTAPSNWDAVRAAIYAVKKASKGRSKPNVVVLDSSDAYAMGATKDTTYNYVIPAWVDRDGTKISGVQVIESNDTSVLPAGEFIVGDWRKVKRRIYKAFNLRLGQFGIVGSATAANIISDWEANMWTFIGEGRQHRYHYKNDETAFIKDDFDTVKTAIEIPVVP